MNPTTEMITKTCVKCGYNVSWDVRRDEKDLCPNCKGDKQPLHFYRHIIQDFASDIRKSISLQGGK